jgi:hypothetical protein
MEGERDSISPRRIKPDEPVQVVACLSLLYRAAQMPQDGANVDPGAIEAGEAGIGFVKDQRELRSRHSRLHHEPCAKQRYALQHRRERSSSPPPGIMRCNKIGHHVKQSVIILIVRTIISLDDDVADDMRAYAQRNEISLGKAASELIRRGLRFLIPVTRRNQIPVFDAPKELPLITSGQVRELLESK